MRLAVISDVHANLEAMEAVILDSEHSGAEKWICLGDNIGYGADPEAVVEKLCSLNITSVLGNHELALLKPEALQSFNPDARQALLINKGMLSEKAVSAIGFFKTFIVRFGCRFVHGIPPGSVIRYLSHVPEKDLEIIMKRLPQRISFVGHTHQLGIIQLKAGEIIRRKFDTGAQSLETGSRYIINAGSVGQPRDGGFKATYVIWDSKEASVEARSVAYNSELAAQKIIKAGIPKRYALRLSGTL